MFNSNSIFTNTIIYLNLDTVNTCEFVEFFISFAKLDVNGIYNQNLLCMFVPEVVHVKTPNNACMFFG